MDVTSEAVRSILLALVARCLETIHVCIWHMFAFMSIVVTVVVCHGQVRCQVSQSSRC